jgi:site-specific recombinase
MKSILKELEIRGTPELSTEKLTVLVAMLRPQNGSIRQAEAAFSEMLQLLKENPDIKENLKWHIRNLILQGNIEQVLSESGVAEGGSFFSEFWNRLGNMFLPELKKNGDLGEVIRTVFYEKDDYRWVTEISDEYWVELFELLGLRLKTNAKEEVRKIFDAATVLSYSLCGNILAKQFKEYDQYRNTEKSPFFRQNRELELFRSKFEKGESLRGGGQRFFEELEKCRLAIEKIKRDRAQMGAGLQQTFLLVKFERQVARLKIITAVLDDEVPFDVRRTVLFFKRIVYFESRKNRLLPLISDNFGLLAFQISEHKSNTGEHYITTTRKEYFQFFRSACGGGIFAASMGIIKIMIHQLHLALFWQHFWYSVNYAIGFVGIHVTGSTLATKQPSMTAAALASSLDVQKKGIVAPEEIAITFGKVWRSQFIAFVGNLLVTFPAAFLFAFLYDIIAGHPISSGEEAKKLIAGQNFLDTPVYLFASVTGIMLFISGIISGYYDNLVLFAKIPERIASHPVLNKFLPRKWMQGIADYTRTNLGSLAGNIALGFLLGFPSFFGNILGIPIDIRHITISTAHYAIGIYGSFFNPDWYHLIGALFGILIIGFMNFAVSFGLAFLVAIKSRNIRFQFFLRIPLFIFRYFKMYPKDFFFPPSKERTPDDLNF